MEAIVFLLVFVGMVVFAILHWIARQDRDLYKEYYEKRENSIKQLTNEKANLKLENMKLRDQLLLTSMYQTNGNMVTDKEMMDAVKYAMKAAHPDNGGKQEDFIKFNALYKKIR